MHCMLNQDDKRIVLGFKKRIPAAQLHHILQIIVFGSRARGDQQQSSDVDIAVLVDHKTDASEHLLENIAYTEMFDNDFKTIISLKVFANDHFQQALTHGYSFYVNVTNEGVAI